MTNIWPNAADTIEDCIKEQAGLFDNGLPIKHFIVIIN